MKDRTKVFLLGGNDLEMEAIRSILKQHNAIVEDKGLEWGACLSSYKEILCKYPKCKYDIYGIELKNDLKDLPSNYHEIDHHNSNENKPSSIEQVCDLIEHKMTRDEKLIAANDARYIPGMRDLGATDDDINDIRKRDREMQGVTIPEEEQAEKQFSKIKSEVKKAGFFYSIKTNLEHFSPLVDRIFSLKEMPFRLLVYTDFKFTFYGSGKDDVMYALKKSDLVKEDSDNYMIPSESIYCGGGNDGYFGGELRGAGKVEWFEEVCRTQKISKHFFMFPFTCSDIKFESFHSSIPWAETVSSNKEKVTWKREIISVNALRDDDLYNELNYFYPHLHNILYDTSDDSGTPDDSCIRHYECKDIKNAQYEIMVNDKITYYLKIDSININFYSTGVGVLILESSNLLYNKNEDILRINQYGRRLFHPFAADAKFNQEGAKFLRLHLEGESIELMNGKKCKPNALSPGLTELIQSFVPLKGDSKDSIRPILDDRMFVLSWYRTNGISFGDDTSYTDLLKGTFDNSFWYRYVFVDVSDPSCQNTDMRASLTEQATYARWQKWGTLYGVSRYSFVMLTNYGCPDHLLKYFETEYVKMSELALIQRASILKYTRALQECTNTKKEFKNIASLSEYYEEYLHFLNNYRFTNISAQDQAIELYEMLCRNIRIKDDSELLDRQFNELQDFMELREEKQANKRAGYLNFLAGMAVPASITSALFGFFFHDGFGTEKTSDFYLDFSALALNPGFWWLAGTVALMIIISLWLVMSKRDK